MAHRRILSLWFPRLAAELVLRQERGRIDGPLAVVEERSNRQVIAALTAAAEEAGLTVGQPLRDALAMCGHLHLRSRQVSAEAQFLTALRRWAGKYTPWVAEAGRDGLHLDLTGCAHLWGGEAALLAALEGDGAQLGLSLRMGLADTLGAAWALSRFAGVQAGSDRSGAAIDLEARATRARAPRAPAPQGGRHWTKGGLAPQVAGQAAPNCRVAPPGEAYRILSPLPVAALRLEPDVVAQLNRLGLRRIGDLLGQPRASLTRRFGRGLLLRLDQAIGAQPEPVSPAAAEEHFAVRLSFPDPIGLRDDLMAGLDRMLPRLEARLAERGKGARVLRLEAHRADQETVAVTLALARAARSPDRIRPLLEMKIDQIDAGYGIDMLRLEVVQAEPLHAKTHAGHFDAAARGVALAQARRGDGDASAAEATAIEDLMGRIGARVGMEALQRWHPADSHIPEKTAQTLAAAWSEPAQGAWPQSPNLRPLLLWPPELVWTPEAPQRPRPVPPEFRWRGRSWQTHWAQGPERIAPEWWLDDPNWHTGVRDYWQVITCCGARLWLFFAHGGLRSGGWFCQGSFA